MKNIMNALYKTDKKGFAVTTTKKNGDKYTKYFRFVQIAKADKYYTEQLGFKKSGDTSGVKVDIAQVTF